MAVPVVASSTNAPVRSAATKRASTSKEAVDGPAATKKRPASSQKPPVSRAEEPKRAKLQNTDGDEPMEPPESASGVERDFSFCVRAVVRKYVGQVNKAAGVSPLHLSKGFLDALDRVVKGVIDDAIFTTCGNKRHTILDRDLGRAAAVTCDGSANVQVSYATSAATTSHAEAGKAVTVC
jgi:hypothetical protein